jgi:hypothetical protein
MVFFNLRKVSTFFACPVSVFIIKGVTVIQGVKIVFFDIYNYYPDKGSKFKVEPPPKTFNFEKVKKQSSESKI